MSQAGFLKMSIPPHPVGVVETLTGNSGGAVGPDILNNINVVGTGFVIVTGTPLSNTLTISLSGAVADSFPTDSGIATPAAGILNIKTQNATNNCGSSVLFSAPGPSNTVQLNVTDVYWNTLIGNLAGNLAVSGNQNTALGYQAGNALTAGGNNTFIGASAGFHVTAATACTAVGNEALAAFISGAAGSGFNNAFGAFSLHQLTSGTYNLGAGNLAGAFLLTGSYNNLLGFQAGTNYTGAESSNIIIANRGTLGESNTIRIGTQGAGNQQQNTCYVAGITGVDVGSVADVVSIATGTGQLGTTTITAGTGISVTPGANTITIAATGITTLAYMNVAVTPYVVAANDEYLSVDCSGGPITIQLPNAATLGRSFIIKDRTGSAAANNITVTTVGGVVLIDGAATYIMNTAYESIEVIGNGVGYEIY